MTRTTLIITAMLFGLFLRMSVHGSENLHVFLQRIRRKADNIEYALCGAHRLSFSDSICAVSIDPEFSRYINECIPVNRAETDTITDMSRRVSGEEDDIVVHDISLNLLRDTAQNSVNASYIAEVSMMFARQDGTCLPQHRRILFDDRTIETSRSAPHAYQAAEAAQGPFSVTFSIGSPFRTGPQLPRFAATTQQGEYYSRNDTRRAQTGVREPRSRDRLYGVRSSHRTNRDAHLRDNKDNVNAHEIQPFQPADRDDIQFGPVQAETMSEDIPRMQTQRHSTHRPNAGETNSLSNQRAGKVAAQQRPGMPQRFHDGAFRNRPRSRDGLSFSRPLQGETIDTSRGLTVHEDVF